MKRHIFFFFLLMNVFLATGQANLRDINFSYLYNPAEEFQLQLKIINLNNQPQLYYEFESVTRNLSDYTIHWEIRSSLSEKEGKSLPAPEVLNQQNNQQSGKLNLNEISPGQIVVAKVTYPDAKGQRVMTIFYKTIPSGITPTLIHKQIPILRTYTNINNAVSIEGFKGNSVYVSHYTSDFPAAGPAFSTAMAKVAVTIKADSAFVLPSDSVVSFTRKGLYLVQSDTTSSEGLAFRIEDDYPKLGRLESLAGPMVYICTKQEFDKLRAAGSDKSQFDKVILSITGNTDRAKTFMRNYFRRVEQANVFFSSYKEGWKTDRGMIYIIYGLPNEVYLLGDREVWDYKNNTVKERFTFIKSSTLFDPENYVLIRDKKYTDKWYEMIDLWRKARF